MQGVMLLNENFVPIDMPPSSTAVSDNEPLFIANPDILLPPRASTPYPVYPGPPPPMYEEDEAERGEYQP